MWPRIFAGENEIVGTEGFYTEIEADKANARRVVACVNACAGIHTDALEQKTVVVSHDYNLANIKQQRDEFLAALKELRGAEWKVTHDWGGDRNAINEKVDAVLAKCEA